MKKITALLLIISIVMSLSVGVFAADEHVYADHAAVKQAASSIEDGTEIEVDDVKYIAVKSYSAIATAIANAKDEDYKVNLYLLADIEWGNTIATFHGSIYGGDNKIILDGKAMFTNLGGADCSFSNFTVKGKTTTKTEINAKGLICELVWGGTFTNITIDESLAVVSTANAVGAFFGQTANGQDLVTLIVQNCINNADVKAGQYVGGFLGGVVGSKSVKLTFKNCENNGTINGTSYLGAAGIIGLLINHLAPAEVTLENCVNNGDVSNTKSQAAGIIGGTTTNAHSNGPDTITIKGCINNGSVTSTTQIDEYGTGGIFGGMLKNGANVTIENCINNGSVSSGVYAGGIFGGATPSKNLAFTITDCVNTGKVSTTVSTSTYCSAIANVQSTKPTLEVTGCMSTVAGLEFVNTVIEDYTFTNPDYAGFIQTKKDGENTLVRFIMVVSKEEMQTAEYTDFTMTVTVNGKTYTQKASELNSYDSVTAAGVEFAATDDFVLFGVVVDLGANSLVSASVNIVDNTSATNVLYSGSYN